MTKFIDKVQKSSQFIIILAFMLRVTELIQQIFNFLLINFCPIGQMGNAMRAVPSHPIPWDIFQGIPMGIPLPWTSLGI